MLCNKQPQDLDIWKITNCFPANDLQPAQKALPWTRGWALFALYIFPFWDSRSLFFLGAGACSRPTLTTHSLRAVDGIVGQ